MGTFQTNIQHCPFAQLTRWMNIEPLTFRVRHCVLSLRLNVLTLLVIGETLCLAFNSDAGLGIKGILNSLPTFFRHLAP
jgi:hypothetical protein